MTRQTREVGASGRGTDVRRRLDYSSVPPFANQSLTLAQQIILAVFILIPVFVVLSYFLAPLVEMLW